MIRRRKRQEQVQPEPKIRAELEIEHGQVWDTAELAKDFIITSILKGKIVVNRKADGVAGMLVLQERPRFYSGFKDLRLPLDG